MWKVFSWDNNGIFKVIAKYCEGLSPRVWDGPYVSYQKENKNKALQFLTLELVSYFSFAVFGKLDVFAFLLATFSSPAKVWLLNVFWIRLTKAVKK